MIRISPILKQPFTLEIEGEKPEDAFGCLEYKANDILILTKDSQQFCYISKH